MQGAHVLYASCLHGLKRLCSQLLACQKVAAVDVAVAQAVEATAVAAARVNATITLLNRLRSEKTSELVQLVSRLPAA